MPYLPLLQSWRYFVLTKRTVILWTGRSCKLNSLHSLSLLGLPPPIAESQSRCNLCGTRSSSHKVSESLSADFAGIGSSPQWEAVRCWLKYPSQVSFYIYSVIPSPVACFSNTLCVFIHTLLYVASVWLLPWDDSKTLKVCTSGV